MERIPTRIDQHSPTEMLLAWNSGESFAVPFVELRFQCPCASCVDEHTGQRVLRRESIAADIRPTGVQLIGRYAVQITWSDGHQTGMYHFDRLFDLAQKQGRRLA
jgi:DUF971 family protein